MSETNVPEMTDEPEWNYPHEMWLLPDNAHTYGERMTASRVKYIRAEPFPALGAIAMQEAAAGVCEDEWVRTGENALVKAVSAIRALALPDHAALLAEARLLPEIAALVGILSRMIPILEAADDVCANEGIGPDAEPVLAEALAALPVAK